MKLENGFESLQISLRRATMTTKYRVPSTFGISTNNAHMWRYYFLLENFYVQNYLIYCVCHWEIVKIVKFLIRKLFVQVN